MGWYRKKPVTVEARQMLGEGELVELAAWCGGELADSFLYGPTITVRTIHGESAICRPGDWIIREPESGRAYPCKPDIFEATYEPAEVEA